MNTFLKNTIRLILPFLFVLFLCGTVSAQRNISSVNEGFIQEGTASYYHNNFNGSRTATGEIFNNDKFTAASNSLPLNTLVKVTNKRNGRWIVLRINDRMHINNKRVIDLSKAAAKELKMISAGLVKVKVEVISQKSYQAHLILKENDFGEGFSQEKRG